MILTPEQISRMEASELFPHLLRQMPEGEWFQREASGYGYTPGPQQWHATLDGNSFESVDLTVGDCGNEIRGAAFVRALMHHAGEQRVYLTVGLSAVGGYDHDGEWTEPIYSASAECKRTRKQASTHGDTPELALLRAYLTVKEAQ